MRKEDVLYSGQFENAMMWMVEERMKPQHFTLSPLEMLMLVEGKKEESDGQ